MTLTGARKRAYQREWERDRRKPRSGHRHVSPTKIGRFVSFDGEGFNRPDGSHCYALLQDSTGAAIEDPSGLSTRACLQFILGAPRRAGGRVCAVSFAFDYDVNNIIKDLPREKLTRLWKEGEVKWGPYRLEWRPRKWFQVSPLHSETNRTIPGQSVRIYDLHGFFQTAFVPACEDWLGKRIPDLTLVRRGKRMRSGFRPADLPFMRLYNAAELRLMVRLAAAVKEAFDLAGIPIFQFYGAGAAGSAFLAQIAARRCIDRHQPPEVERAGRHGYVGGRIEVPTYGEIAGPIHRYDLNSAHPSVIATLPNLRAGSWTRDKQFRRELPLSIYHLSWSFPPGRQFYPFPWRSPEGAIFFPPTGRAWVWGPELAAALEVGGFLKRSIRVLDAWHFRPEDPTDRPFKVVEEKYAIRKALEAEGKAAARAIKLCLNSMDGKFAQSVSAAGRFGGEDGHARKPTYHQIEYAGYICSAVRASVYRAGMQKPESILTFATDAVLSREPLDLPVSEKLGEWSAEEFQRATIVQSGVYRLQGLDGKWETHGRGFADKNLPWGRIRWGWIRGKRRLNVTGRRRRFIGLGAAIQWDDWDNWRRFERIPREVQLAAVGKRVDLHLPPTWTVEDNPATRPHYTEAYDPVRLEGYDSESTPWRPKWEDPDARTVEDWELTVESGRRPDRQPVAQDSGDETDARSVGAPAKARQGHEPLISPIHHAGD